MNLQTSTLKFDETGEPLHIQQAAQIRAFRAAWKKAGHARTPRVSVSRSIFALLDDRDRAYFGRGGQEGIRLVSLTKTRGRFSAEAMLLSRMFSLNSSGKMKPSRRPTRSC